MKYLKRLLRIRPPFDWVQIEISTVCNAKCVYCPCFEYRNCWDFRYFPFEWFLKLESILPDVCLVFLQGWGEPLLHKDFFRIVSFIKKFGCSVGTTTNGMPIDKDVTMRIVDSQMDVIAFSLAGTSSNNDIIRRGTSIEHVIRAIEWLQEAKVKMGSRKPSINIAYTALKSFINEIKGLSSIVSSLDVDQVVISPLTLAVSPSMERELIYGGNSGEFRRLEEMVENLKANFRWGYERIFLNIPDKDKYICGENIRRSFFVSSFGMVAPCVFLSIPAKNEMFHRRNLYFGSILNKDIVSIWKKEEFRTFRAQVYSSNPPAYCSGCMRHFIHFNY